MIAALFVETDGIYYNLPDIDPWDKNRDARKYNGPYKVIAHPPCARWGRFWHGGPSSKIKKKLGDDDGCFNAAINAVRRWGGIIEHPEGSHAWKWYNLNRPPRSGGWVKADYYGYTCCVEQGHYGHIARKMTWLYAVNTKRDELIWGSSGQRLPEYAITRYGYEKARRIGVMAAIGGKNKTKLRNATPIQFRDLLISMLDDSE